MRILIGPNSYGLDAVIPTVQARHPDVEIEVCTERELLADALREADIYLGWLSREAYLGGGKLKWIQSPSTGVDSFLRIPELRDGDVLLTGAKGTHAACLAESAIAMIFAFTRGIRTFIDHQDRKAWASRTVRNALVELTESTVGIVGFGTVGQALAARVQAFGACVVATDAFPGDKPDYVERLTGPEGLGGLLTESDYVVVTVPLVATTRHMIDAAAMAKMKPTAMLVGISRGGVIDEGALAGALISRRIAAAALDVFEKEPLPEDSPLWDIDNLLITPHAAGGSQHESRHIQDIFIDNVDRFVAGDVPLRNLIDKQRGF